MSGRQWIGVAIVAVAIAASFVVPQLELGGGPEPEGPTHGCAGARDEPDERATLCLLNAERKDHGLAPLRTNATLRRAARRHATDMAEHEFFAHEAPDGSDPHQRIRRAGYRDARLTGENLAKGEREAGAPSAIVDGWMHSPGHRANILRPGFEEIGVAIAEDGDTAYYVTTFGAR